MSIDKVQVDNKGDVQQASEPTTAPLPPLPVQQPMTMPTTLDGKLPLGPHLFGCRQTFESRLNAIENEPLTWHPLNKQTRGSWAFHLWEHQNCHVLAEAIELMKIALKVKRNGRAHAIVLVCSGAVKLAFALVVFILCCCSPNLRASSPHLWESGGLVMWMLLFLVLGIVSLCFGVKYLTILNKHIGTLCTATNDLNGFIMQFAAAKALDHQFFANGGRAVPCEKLGGGAFTWFDGSTGAVVKPPAAGTMLAVPAGTSLEEALAACGGVYQPEVAMMQNYGAMQGSDVNGTMNTAAGMDGVLNKSAGMV